MEVEIYENEILEDLEFNNLKIIQNNSLYKFGMDPILLSYFATIKNSDSIIDLGTGTGIIPILISQKANSLKINAFEIQKDCAEMAERSIKYNNLSNINIINDNIINAFKYLSKASQNVVICNPPYGLESTTIKSKNATHMISKHETETSLEEFITIASSLLRYNGRFYICFPCRYMLYLLDTLRRYKLEPKRIRYVQSKPNKNPYIMLVEAVKNAKPHMIVENCLIVNNEYNEFTEELKKIYHIDTKSIE